MTAEALEVVPLQPKLKMSPNEPCWCGSGRKWKKCHKDRATAEPQSFFQENEKLEAEFRRGYCLHPDAPVGCDAQIAKAHTVEKSNVLSTIAENGHVISARGDRNNLFKTGGRLIPQKIGINRASTFPGFCRTHDTTLFKPIEESELKVSPQSAFLWMFRAMAMEVFNKQAATNSIENTRGADAGLPFPRQVMIQQTLHAMLTGSRAAIAELDALRMDMADRYRHSDYAGISALSTVFEGTLPIAASFLFHPEFDMEGSELQSLLDVDLEFCAFTTTVRDGRTFATFSWFDDVRGRAAQFARSFGPLPDDDKATAIALLCFVHSENWHARPSWWEGLSVMQKSAIEKLMGLGMPREGMSRSSGDYALEAMPLRIEMSVAETLRI